MDAGQASGPQPQLIQKGPPALPPAVFQNAAPAPAATPEVRKEDVKAHASNAKEAATVARQAAKVANQVAKHSVKVTGHAKKALKHALGALHDARVESSGLDRHQTTSLKKAEAHLREATKSADYGKLKKNKNERDLQKEKMQEDLGKADVSKSENEELSEEIKELRR